MTSRRKLLCLVCWFSILQLGNVPKAVAQSQIHDTKPCDGFLNTPSGPRCYRVMDETKTQQDAETHCRAQYGGHLMSVSSAEVTSVIDSLIRPKHRSLGEFWIGAVEELHPWKWQGEEEELYDQGCYKIGPGDSPFPFQTELQSNSPKVCVDRCRQEGYKYARVQEGSKCLCSQQFREVNGMSLACNYACSGDRDVRCGGRHEFELFVVDGAFSNWGPDLPNDHLEYQACAIMDHDESFQHNDVECALRYGTLCDIGSRAPSVVEENGGTAEIKCFPRDENENTTRCYFLSDVKVSWFKANEKCRDLDGRLATFKNIADVQLEVLNYVKGHADFKDTNFWIGLTRNSWRWESGDTFVYTDWNRYSRPKSEKKNCVTQDSDGWHDVECNSRERYVCEYARTIPFVYSVTPQYGPVSGGTRLTISGSFLTSTDNDNSTDDLYPPVVQLDDLLCNITMWNTDRVVADTPALGGEEEGLLGRELLISLTQNHSTTEAIERFVYKPDPLISDVEPMEALATGGIALTASGRNLDSVHQSHLTITRVYQNETTSQETQYSSECNKAKSTRMICPTPEVEVPPQFRLQTHTETERLDFYLGFIQDGFKDFRDLRNTGLKAYIKIITEVPDIEKWTEVKEHTAGDSLLIKGERMMEGCRVGDYIVTIGTKRCTDLSLTATTLHCLPPEQEPPKNKSLAVDEGHRVYVSIGDYQTYVGLLKYVKSNWYDNPLVLAGIGAGVFVLALIIVVPVCVHVCRKKNRNRDDGLPIKGQPQRELENKTIVTRNPSLEMSSAYLHTEPKQDTGYLEPQPAGAYIDPAPPDE